MAGLLSGLEVFGLKGMDNVNDIYDGEKKEEEQKKAEVEKDPVQIEQDMLFEKSFTCPICDIDFKSKTVRIGKAKLLKTDLDLRPKYENVDMLKYDVILCPHCGYAALSRYFKFITSPQARLIKENISPNFKHIKEKGVIYTYEEALSRYKLTLANAIVKKAKPSEKAYICLKTAWLLRGAAESLKKDEPDYEQKKAELSGLLPDCYSIYEVCPEGLENEEGVGKISLNGCSPFYCEGAIEIRTAALPREKFLELFEQTRPYHIIYGYSNDRSSALCRGIRPSEAVYRDGKFYGIRAIYHDEGEYNDRTLAWIEEPFDAPFILEIGKEAKTHVSCFCKLTRRAELQGE